MSLYIITVLSWGIAALCFLAFVHGAGLPDDEDEEELEGAAA